MNLLGYGREYVFYSSLTFEECAKTLRHSGSYKDLVAKINGDRFQLFRNKGLIPITSAYNPVFFGKFVDIGAGTRIEGFFGLSTLSFTVTIALFFWLTFVPLFWGAPIWIAPLAFSICSLITMINMLWGKQEMGPILDFIQHEFQATSVT